MGMMRQAATVVAAGAVAALAGCASASPGSATAGAPTASAVTSAATGGPKAAASGLPSPPSATATGTTAESLCRTALGQSGTSTMVTVADVRDYATGPAAKSAPDAFPNAASTDPAAWCWVHAGTNLNIAYAVRAGDKAVRMVAEGGASATTELMTGIPHFP